MWLSDLRLVLPDRVLEHGSLKIENGRIARIIEGPAPERGVSIPGLIAIPGIIDLHGDMLERDIEPRPRAMFPIEMALDELDKRLAGAGVTTAYAAVSFAWNKSDVRRQEVAEKIIRTIHARRDTLLVDFLVHARFEVNNTATIPIVNTMMQEQLVHLLSINDHRPGQGQYGDVERFVTFINEWLGISKELLGQQIMDRMHEKLEETPEITRDWSVVREVLRIAREHNIIVASHDDDTPEKVAEQAALGVTISEFPVNLTAAQAAREHGMHVIMGAPNAYRGESNTGNLSALDAIQAGMVDILATDYFPAAPLHAAFRIAERGVLPLHESVKLVSQNPADAMGLADRGRLDIGRWADIVLVETNGTHPRVRGTLRHGVPIFRDSAVFWQSHQQDMQPL